MEDNEFNRLRRLLEATRAEAVPAAEEAAAQVYLQAARAAAPRKSGRLADSIQIVRGRTRGALSESGQRLFVGPEKKKGYYGYFLEKGYVSVGSRRRKRAATATTHSQRGSEGGRNITARAWFGPAIKAVDSQAEAAAVAAFEAKVRELDARK
jgi:hypothetical protein